MKKRPQPWVIYKSKENRYNKKKVINKTQLGFQFKNQRGDSTTHHSHR